MYYLKVMGIRKNGMEALTVAFLSHLSCQWWPASVRCGLGGWGCWWLSACFHLSPTVTWTLTTSHTRGSEQLCPPGSAHQEVKMGKCGRRVRTEGLSVNYLIVEVVNLQLIAPPTVGEVETAVFFNWEQFCVLMLFKDRGCSVTQK